MKILMKRKISSLVRIDSLYDFCSVDMIERILYLCSRLNYELGVLELEEHSDTTNNTQDSHLIFTSHLTM